MRKRESKRAYLYTSRHSLSREGMEKVHDRQRRNVIRGERHHALAETPESLQRVVTVPEADPSTAWNMFSQRQRRMRTIRARQQPHAELVQRTFAQTGMRAASGRIKVEQRAMESRPSSPIPVRSGQRKGRRGLLRKLLGVLALVLVVALAINFVLNSSTFRIMRVDVVGTHNETLIQTIQRIGIQGQNIFLLDVEALKDRIESLPLVAEASLHKQLPNALTVTVVERVPALIWQGIQGAYGIDRQGIVIAPLSELTGSEHLNVVTDMNPSEKIGSKWSLRPGMHLNQADILFALTIFDRMSQMRGIAEFKLQYDGTIYASNDKRTEAANDGGSFIIVSSSGWKAYLGSVNDVNSLDNRLAELQQIILLTQRQQLKVAVIDLRYGLRPVYTVQS